MQFIKSLHPTYDVVELAYVYLCVIGCFNERVVTLVTDRLKRRWLQEVYFCNCIRQLASLLALIVSLTMFILGNICKVTKTTFQKLPWKL